MADLSYLDAVILGVVEGLTEYLPVSSTGHLTITEKLLGLEVNDPAVTAYTAVIQLGAIAATLLYFFRDIVRFAVAWFRGLGSAAARRTPTTASRGPSSSARSRSASSASSRVTSSRAPLRSLWVVAVALLLWSVAMVVAERIYARYEARGAVRDEHSVRPSTVSSSVSSSASPSSPASPAPARRSPPASPAASTASRRRGSASSSRSRP